MDWLDNGPFTFFDVETTGMSPLADRIIEIGAVRVGRDRTQKNFSSLVNPERPIPAEIVSLTGLDSEILFGAPPFRRAGAEFLRFAEGSILVAHNALFDLAFLQESLRRDDLPAWSGRTIDSIRIFKMSIPGLPSYSLGFLQEHFGMSIEKNRRHRALDDAEMLMRIFAMNWGK